MEALSHHHPLHSLDVHTDDPSLTLISQFFSVIAAEDLFLYPNLVTSSHDYTLQTLTKSQPPVPCCVLTHFLIIRATETSSWLQDWSCEIRQSCLHTAKHQPTSIETFKPLTSRTSLVVFCSCPLSAPPRVNATIHHYNHPLCAYLLSCFSHTRFVATPWTVACQAPLSMGFSGQEYWNRLPHPPPGDFPNPGIESVSFMFPTLGSGFFIISTTWEALVSTPLPCPLAMLTDNWKPPNTAYTNCSTPTSPGHKQLNVVYGKHKTKLAQSHFQCHLYSDEPLKLFLAITPRNLDS